MWGRMNRIESQANDLYNWGNYGFTLPRALWYATWYKIHIQSAPPTMVAEVTAFVTYGYNGTFSAPPPLPCPGTDCGVSDPSFEWRWRGLTFKGPVPK